MLTFKVEKWDEFYPDAKELFPLHWREIALWQDKYGPDIDTERYKQLSDLGILFILTVRCDVKLVGYLVALLMPHLHYKSAGTMALIDLYYVRPDYRSGTGTRMFMRFESEMRKCGVVQLLGSCKVHLDHSKLFQAMGWQHTDHTFSKPLI
ncbi:MAG TPA: GNAT family N-acetyltransferase [Terriglobales bacterium]|nr:GNAT family N-acetyltransferase [Terriglobales bacterium]